MDLIAIHKEHAATRCNTLQYTAYSHTHWAHCKTLQDTARHWMTLQNSTTHCNTLQHVAIPCLFPYTLSTLQDTARHCTTLDDTTKQYNTLQHAATLCNTLLIPIHTEHIARHCKTLHDTARHYKTVQHTATHCTTLMNESCPQCGLYSGSHCYNRLYFGGNRISSFHLWPSWCVICSSVFQRVAAYCSVLQRVAVCCKLLTASWVTLLTSAEFQCYSVLQCVAVWGSLFFDWNGFFSIYKCKS